MNTETDPAVDAIFEDTRRLAQTVVGPLFNDALKRLVAVAPKMTADTFVRRFAEAWNVPDRMT